MTPGQREALGLARDALRSHPPRCMCGAHPPGYRCLRCRALDACERELAAAPEAPTHTDPDHTEVAWRDGAAP